MTRPRVPWPVASSVIVGVMGDPVAHSLSPVLHNTAFAAMGLDWASIAFRVRAGETEQAVAGVRALGVRGVSVTMPHKGEAARLADRLSATARVLRAVNCLSLEDGMLVGHNTDGAGFLESLRRGAGFDPGGRRCVVAGAGGAARAVVLALAEAGSDQVTVVNRTAARAEAAAALAGSRGRVGVPEDAEDADLVVNATPAGMGGAAPDARPPIPPELLHHGQVAVDLIYEPRVTAWLAAARARGAAGVEGLGMLVHQAAAQLRVWTGDEVPVEEMWAAVR